MSLKRTVALVLALQDHGESDKIVTFSCPGLGKLTGIAKGAKRSKRRFVNKLELFSLLEILYDDQGRSSLVRVAEAELLDPFISLRERYDRYLAGMAIVEQVLLWTRENDVDEELFPLLVWALANINQGMASVRVVILFQSKLLKIMGYRPHLSGCLKCGRIDAPSGPYGFSPSRGGLLCGQCRGSADLAPVSPGTAKLLENVLESPWDRLDRLHFSNASLKEAVTLFRRYVQYLLQRECPAWGVLLQS